MVPRPGRPLGLKNIQHEHRHLVGRLHHGRDVHRSPSVPRHDQRRSTPEDISTDGHPERAFLARHHELSGVQARLARLRDARPSNDSPNRRTRRFRSAGPVFAAEAGDEGEREGCDGSCLVPRLAHGEGATAAAAAGLRQSGTDAGNGRRRRRRRRNAAAGTTVDGDDGGRLWYACLSMREYSPLQRQGRNMT